MVAHGIQGENQNQKMKMTKSFSKENNGRLQTVPNKEAGEKSPQC